MLRLDQLAGRMTIDNEADRQRSLMTPLFGPLGAETLIEGAIRSGDWAKPWRSLCGQDATEAGGSLMRLSPAPFHGLHSIFRFRPIC